MILIIIQWLAKAWNKLKNKQTNDSTVERKSTVDSDINSNKTNSDVNKIKKSSNVTIIKNQTTVIEKLIITDIEKLKELGLSNLENTKILKENNQNKVEEESF